MASFTEGLIQRGQAGGSSLSKPSRLTAPFRAAAGIALFFTLGGLVTGIGYLIPKSHTTTDVFGDPTTARSVSSADAIIGVSALGGALIWAMVLFFIVGVGMSLKKISDNTAPAPTPGESP